MDEVTKSKEATELFKAVLKLENVSECKKFFRDLCTVSEIKAMSERFQVAKKVDLGVSYRKINKMTGASTATVTRVAHFLHHGMGGYKLILKRLDS